MARLEQEPEVNTPTKSTAARYIPALRYAGLTPLYDPVLRWLMKEGRFKGDLIRQAGIRPGQKVLDLGCGTATLTIQIKQAYPEAEVIGLDGDPRVLEIARAKAARAGVSITLDEGLSSNMPYADASIDRVVSSLLFHHLSTENKLATMAEAHRVLRPGGEMHVADFGRQRGLWSRLISTITARLEQAGDNYAGQLPTFLHQAGFEHARETRHYPTFFGTLYLLEAYKTFS